MRVPATKESLLACLPWDASEDSIQRIKEAYPNVSVAAYKIPWGEENVPKEVTPEQLAEVTILLTGSAIPDKDAVPNLKLVQLASAGANHVLNHPLFKDTDVKFSTANGVHGYVVILGPYIHCLANDSPLAARSPQISEWVISTFLAFQHHSTLNNSPSTGTPGSHPILRPSSTDTSLFRPQVPRVPARRQMESPRCSRRLGES